MGTHTRIGPGKLWVLCAACLVLQLAAAASAADRMVLAEGFTATW